MKNDGQNSNNDNSYVPPEVKTLKEYPPIDAWSGANFQAQLRARIIEVRGQVYFDLREYRTSSEEAGTEGFTKRGVRLKLRDIKRLAYLLPNAERDMQLKLAELIPGWNPPRENPYDRKGD